MLIDPAQLAEVKSRISKVIDPNVDSVRFYNLGKNWEHRVEILKADKGFNQEGTIIL